MKNSLRYFSFALLLFVLGCEQVIPIDLPKQTPVLVLNSSFTPDSVWQARLTSSISIQDTGGFPEITDGLILIEDNGVVVDTLTHMHKGTYRGLSPRRPEVGHNYTVRASANGYETVTGTDLVPTPVQILTPAIQDSAEAGPFEDWSAEVSFSIDDPGNEDNYYIAYIYRMDTFISFPDTFYYPNPIWPSINDPIFEFDANSNGVMFTDASFNGQTRNLRMLISDYETENGVLYIGLSTCTEHYYKYVQTVSSFVQNGFNPFAEPVRIYSNMSSSMGIFAAFSSDFEPIP